MKTSSILKALVGIVVIGAGTGYFMFRAMQSSWSYYYSVDDFAENRAAVAEQSLRLAGVVKAGTVERNREKMNLEFTLAGVRHEIPVHYLGTIPDNFVENGEVVVEGRLDQAGTFQAETLITKCESKYQAKVNK